MSYLNPNHYPKTSAATERASADYNLGAYGLFVWVSLIFGFALVVLF